MSVFDDIFKENFHINSPFSNPRASSWVKYTCSTRKSRGSYTSMRCCSRGIIQGLHARIYTTSLESSDWLLIEQSRTQSHSTMALGTRLLIELLSTSFPGLQCEDVLLWKIILQNILVHTRIIKIQMLNCYCQLSSSVIFRQYGVSQSECKIDRPKTRASSCLASSSHWSPGNEVELLFRILVPRAHLTRGQRSATRGSGQIHIKLASDWPQRRLLF
jgi:hypothetical protein